MTRFEPQENVAKIVRDGESLAAHLNTTTKDRFQTWFKSLNYELEQGLNVHSF